MYHFSEIIDNVIELQYELASSSSEEEEEKCTQS